MNGTRKEASFVSIATAVGLITGALSGGMYMGSLAQEVEQVKKDVEKVEEIQRDVTTIKVTQAGLIASQAAILRAQDTQDKKLDKILEKLEEDN
jgi:hypothetical protein